MNIFDDPEAMEAVRVLRDKGYTADHVKDYMRLLELHRKAVARSANYKCTHGHDQCWSMYPGPECPTCERR